MVRSVRGAAMAAAALATIGATAHPAAAQDPEVHRLEGPRVAVYNLAGRMDVVRGSGPDVVVRVSRGGAQGSSLRVEVVGVDGRRALRVEYPAAAIVYPPMGPGSSTAVGEYGGGRDRMTVRGRGDGVEAWADLRIEVPPGRSLEAFVAVGEVTASALEGDLSIDTGWGAVDARDIRGRLLVDTGSGSIAVADVQGDVRVDTGSGSVRLAALRGETIVVDTGSGRVEGSDLAAASVRIDTGSGGIDLRAVDSPDVHLDTGSGAVEVDLLRDVDRLEIDTGSGSVTVRVTEALGARLEVETGSGAIDVEFPVELGTMRRDHLRGVVGDGQGQIRIDTGSGSIRLVRR